MKATKLSESLGTYTYTRLGEMEPKGNVFWLSRESGGSRSMCPLNRSEVAPADTLSS